MKIKVNLFQLLHNTFLKTPIAMSVTHAFAAVHWIFC